MTEANFGTFGFGVIYILWTREFLNQILKMAIPAEIPDNLILVKKMPILILKKDIKYE